MRAAISGVDLKNAKLRRKLLPRLSGRSALYVMNGVTNRSPSARPSAGVEYVENGLSPADARTRALARFGSVALAADQCRDARGTTFIDASVRDILYAFRTFSRTPMVALTVVATVALGLGLVSVVFAFFNMFVFRVDAVRNPGELFAVERVRSPGAEGRVRFTLPQYDALRREASPLVPASQRRWPLC